MGEVENSVVTVTELSPPPTKLQIPATVTTLVENFEMEPEVRGTSGWVKFCSLVALIIFVQKPKVNPLRNDHIAV